MKQEQKHGLSLLKFYSVGDAMSNVLSIKVIGARMGCVCNKIGGCGYQVLSSKILGARMGCVCDKIGGDAGTKISSYKILGARMGCGGGVCGYQDQAANIEVGVN